MKICIIAPYNVLSLNEGASIRVFELAKALNACGATVFVLHHGSTKSFNSNFKFINFKSCDFLPGSGNYLHPVNPFYPSYLTTFLRKYKPHIIQCEAPWSMFPTLFFSRHFRIPCVLDEHNVEFLWAMHASKVPFSAPATFALEKIASSYASLILATSEVDKKLLMRIYNVPQEKIFIIPNGVDTQRFSVISTTQARLKMKLFSIAERKIVLFHGIMSARQNYEAARLIVDLVAPEISKAIFLIIGKNPPRWLEMKAKTQKNVLILGYVANIEEYIMAADICIAPIQSGSGTRLKVLEYAAAGKPVVATFKAVEGLGMVNGVHGIFHQNVNEDFVTSIIRLMNDEKFAKEIGLNNIDFSKIFDWFIIGKKLYAAYSDFWS